MPLGTNIVKYRQNFYIKLYVGSMFRDNFGVRHPAHRSKFLNILEFISRQPC